MDQVRRSFDKLAFLGRAGTVAVIATWLLIERLRNHDRAGAALFAAFGYVVWPIIAYLHTRYWNRGLTFGIVDIVKRKLERRSAKYHGV